MCICRSCHAIFFTSLLILSNFIHLVAHICVAIVIEGMYVFDFTTYMHVRTYLDIYHVLHFITILQQTIGVLSIVY